MIVDLDDFCEDSHRLDLLEELRAVNPEFRCTLFAIPAHGSDEFWRSVPEWCELAVHGWAHPDPGECEHWTREQMELALDARQVRTYFTNGWKSPGWQSSSAVYEVLCERGWWIAEHWTNGYRLPLGLRRHVIAPNYRTSGDHWHGHISDVCGNGLSETFAELRERVEQADSFQLVSEVVT